MEHNFESNVIKSYNRCCSDGDFWGDFYDIFIQSSEEIRAMFKHTNFEVQKRVVKRSLQILIMYVHSPNSADILDELDRIARIHDHNHISVKPELYDLWLDSLLKAVSRNDPLCNNAILQEWHANLSKVIDYIRSRY